MFKTDLNRRLYNTKNYENVYQFIQRAWLELASGLEEIDKSEDSELGNNYHMPQDD